MKISAAFFLFSCLISSTVNGQQQIECQTKWKYSELKETVSGVVVYHEQPIVMCGVVATASVTLLQTSAGDTIRILSLCHIKGVSSPNEFRIGAKVSITPQAKPGFRVDLIPEDPKACSLKKAYFGIIKLIE
jgi:hypothetical protein